MKILSFKIFFTELNLLTYLLIRYIKIVKIFGRLFAIWPLSDNAKKWEIYLDKLIWYFFHISLWLFIVPTFATAYKERFSLQSLVSSINQLLIIFETLFLMVLFKIARLRFRILLKMSYEFITFTKDSALQLMRRFTKTYLVTFSFTTMIYLLVVFIFVYRSITIKPLRLPINVYYPFLLDSSIIWNIFYIHQLMCMYYVTVTILVDSIIVLLILTSTMKLQYLQIKFKNIKTHCDIVHCIQDHQKIIWFVQETNYVVRYLILKTIISLCGFFVSEAVKLLNSDVSTILKAQFLLLFVIGLSRLYFYAYCAETMTTLGFNLGFVMYSSPWYEQTHKMKTYKYIIISRCQKPLNISVAGIMPSLNMKYLGHFLYLTFSYIMTFRAITRNYG